MLKAFKTEIHPTSEQAAKIRRTIGVCRWVYNFYLSHNNQNYRDGGKFISGMTFSKWLNNEFLPEHPEMSWVKEVSSKAVKQAIMNGEKAFKKFFKGLAGRPSFKKKKRQDVSCYFPKNSQTEWTVERHRVKIPTLGWIRLKEKGYIPRSQKVTSGTVSMKTGRYFVSVLTDLEEPNKSVDMARSEGIGIDLGVKDFAISSHLEKPFKNINKTRKIRFLEKKLRREQRRLSRKYEMNKKKKRGDKSASQSVRNIVKKVRQIQAIHYRLANIRSNYVSQVVASLVKTKPAFITIEDLNVRGMMKNRHLAKSIGQQKFSEFRTKLITKAKALGIEIRVVDRFYPSSKTCSECGFVKKDLQLSDRVYVCPSCGIVLDRDKNAALNLAHANVYKVA